MLKADGTIYWQLKADEAQAVLNAVTERPYKEVARLYQNLVQQSQPEPPTPPEPTDSHTE